MEPRQLLQRHFGFDDFRPGQQTVVDALLAGRSALAVFPTGGGKSLCYQLPALAFDGVTVVVSPLIALMKDQIDFLTRRGIAAARLDSTLSLDELRALDAQLAAGTLKLLYVSPERFNNERFLHQLERIQISLMAIDEAHCISEWGHNFRPDYLKLAELARRVGVERVLALTATATPGVVADIRAAFGIAAEDGVVTGFARPNLSLRTTPVAEARRDALLVERLKSRPPGATIVYVTLQKTAEALAETLTRAGLPAEAYHAGLDDATRVAVQERWMASSQGIVVATIAFGMGIDKADVRYVYHANLPKSLESYSQEVGRAGRDGAPSVCEMLASPDDVPTLENFVYGDTPTSAALSALVDELLSLGPEFAVSVYDLSSRHDIRHLVVRTILTYLELDGVLRQGTPFYAGYEMRLRGDHTPRSAAASFGPHGSQVDQLFAVAREGRVWYALDPERAAAQMGVDRRRVVRTLEVLEERGFVELRASDVRQRFWRLREREDPAAIAQTLVRRFEGRETAELERLRRVLALVEHDGCQASALTAYFGEALPAPCGECTFCREGVAQRLPAPRPVSPIPEVMATEVDALRRRYPAALGEARQLARFLCGLSSPATSRARLGRHPLSGSLERHRFADVLCWVREKDGTPGAWSASAATSF